MTRALMFLIAFLSSGETLVAESPQRSFVKVWEGRTVTVKATLYSLIYNERGTFGTSRGGLREGLIVVTPSQGAFLRFDSRQGRRDVIERDPQRFIAAVNSAYEPDVLDVRSYRKLDAIAINRYDPGTELLVTGVHVGRDQVQVEFAKVDGGEVVTGITVKWPMPLSNVFTERALVEGLIQRFVEIKQP